MDTLHELREVVPGEWVEEDTGAVQVFSLRVSVEPHVWLLVWRVRNFLHSWQARLYLGYVYYSEARGETPGGVATEALAAAAATHALVATACGDAIARKT